MPTNILRRQSRRTGPVAGAAAQETAGRTVIAHIGRCTLRIELLPTLTADRIWQQLPLFSFVETWGDCVHFETRIETGRERGARLNVTPGAACFWVEEQRVMLPFGPTPISRPGEVRLMSPCNIWGKVLGELGCLATVTPTEKVSLERAP